ncbi:hypothetical protein [Streptomyces sp. NPDC058092]
MVQNSAADRSGTTQQVGYRVEGGGELAPDGRTAALLNFTVLG